MSKTTQQEMAHDVFISYSARDKVAADAICVKLESRGIRCWIAPRDIQPGMSWGGAIVDAIDGARVMLLLFSSHANASPQIKREVERAVSKEQIIVPVRVEDIKPTGDFEYFLGTPHWLDAISQPFEQHLEKIADSAKFWLERVEGGSGTASVPPPPPISTVAPASPVARASAPDESPALTAAETTPRSERLTSLRTYLIAALMITAFAGVGFFRVRYFQAQRQLAQKREGAGTVAPEQQPETEQGKGQHAAQERVAAEPQTREVAPKPKQAGKLVASGDAALMEKDYATALKEYQQASGQGDAEAEWELGRMYFRGWGVDKNYPEALKWFRKSAEQGNALAAHGLGEMYMNGWGADQDYSAAIKWYRISAEQGNALGEYGLGVMRMNGWGVDKNYSMAVKWYRKSAEQGNALGQHGLGVMYMNGWGVDKDYSEAVKWYRKSAEQGNALGECGLGIMYMNGWGVDKDKGEAIEWYQKAAAQGNQRAQKALSRLR
ncbi:MAG: TIR domain-containing protein [Candidatus Binataceae bacterium]